jgi:hypothetical protein
MFYHYAVERATAVPPHSRPGPDWLAWPVLYYVRITDQQRARCTCTCLDDGRQVRTYVPVMPSRVLGGWDTPGSTIPNSTTVLPVHHPGTHPLTFDDPESAGLERHDLHAVLQPVPARLQCNAIATRPYRAARELAVPATSKYVL